MRTLIAVALALLAGCQKEAKEVKEEKPVPDAAQKQQMKVGGKLSNLFKDATGVKCDQRARDVKGNEGTSWYMRCPANCAEGPVWGTDLYTDDSAVCRAAIHAGAIDLAQGGMVLVTWTPGELMYGGSERNGIASGGWGQWGRSFFVQAVDDSGQPTTPAVEPLPAGHLRAGCLSPATNLPGEAGSSWHIHCPPGCLKGPVYGTDLYTSDSAICVAAIHAGISTFSDGGDVDVVLDGAQTSFEGTTRNGVTTARWGEFGGSFRFAAKSP